MEKLTKQMRNWTDQDIEAAYSLGIICAMAKYESNIPEANLVSEELIGDVKKSKKQVPELMEQLRYPK